MRWHHLRIAEFVTRFVTRFPSPRDHGHAARAASLADSKKSKAL
jgi:hypothetical protein